MEEIGKKQEETAETVRNWGGKCKKVPKSIKKVYRHTKK